MRHVFVTILVFCEPASPSQLWERLFSDLSDVSFHSLELHVDNLIDRRALARKEPLFGFEHILQQHGLRVSKFDGLLTLDRSCSSVPTNDLFQKERMFDVEKHAHIGH